MIPAPRVARLLLPARPPRRGASPACRALVVLAVGTVFALASSPARAQAEATPALTNVICPVMTDVEVDPEIWVEHEGRRIYLCCQKCRRLFDADPAKYLPNLVLVAAEPQGAANPSAPTVPTAAAQPLPQATAPTTALLPRKAPPSLLDRVGRWHIAALHFPLALLIVAALIEVARPRSAPGGLAALRIVLALGAAGAVVAAGLGLLLEGSVEQSHAHDAPHLQLLEWHKWAGIATAALAVVACALVERRARRPGSIPPALATGAALLAAAVVGLCAHFGGQMVWGRDFLIPW